MGKSRFILPNAFTSMNFLLGVFAICWVTGAFSSFTSSDPIRTGAYFIILSVLLDKLDGFAARLVNASSEFGAQFDSLADLIAFGLAPAFTVFFTYKTLAPEWFQANGALLIVTFSIYVLCAAMRLAKYNACDSDVYHHHFSGLPSTFAGAINAILIVYLKSNGLFENPENPMMIIPVLVMLVTGLLMVSPLSSYSDSHYLCLRIPVYFGKGSVHSGIPAGSLQLLPDYRVHSRPHSAQKHYRRSRKKQG